MHLVIIMELNKKLLLASGSLSRKKIMERANLDFEIVLSDIDEDKIKKYIGKVDSMEKAINYVKILAYEKGKSLKDKLNNSVILSADTIAFLDNEILEKPKDEKDARRIFNMLSDTVHYAITGVSIITEDFEDNFAIISEVRVKNIEEELQNVLVKDKLTYTYAGGYCIDGMLKDKVIVCKEDFNNVMGLPIEIIIKKLKEAGYDFSKQN